MPDTTQSAFIAAGAALLAAIVAAAASMGALTIQDRRQRKADRDATLDAAAITVLNKSMTIYDRARSLGTLLQASPRWDASLAVLMRLRAPLDSLALVETIIVENEALRQAALRIVLSSDQVTITLCNDVLIASEMVARVSMPQVPTKPLQHITGSLSGWRMSNTESIAQACVQLDHARSEFANHLRSIKGGRDVDIFAASPPARQPASPPVRQSASPPARQPASGRRE